jgi:hypothetical protein
MKLQNTILTLVPAAMLVMACGGESTPAESPEGAAIEENADDMGDEEMSGDEMAEESEEAAEEVSEEAEEAEEAAEEAEESME